MINVALTVYTFGEEETFYETMPAVPRVGDTVHYSMSGDAGDSRAWHVFNVSWVQSAESWEAEVALR